MILADLIGQELPADPPFPVYGESAEWTRAANMLFAVGCEPQAFVLLASLASPRMALIEHKEGGAVVSIHGGKGAGKTVALTAAASVWGAAPDELSDLGIGLGQLPSILTRLANQDPAVIRQRLQSFALGPGRKAVLISATGAPLPLNPGEIPGVEFDLRVPRALIAPKDGDRIAGHLLANRGHAGEKYLRYLADADAAIWARKRLASAIAGLRDELAEVPDAWRFAIRLIAACRVAGEIAVRLELIEADPDRIARWAVEKGLKA